MLMKVLFSFFNPLYHNNDIIILTIKGKIYNKIKVTKAGIRKSDSLLL